MYVSDQKTYRSFVSRHRLFLFSLSSTQPLQLATLWIHDGLEVCVELAELVSKLLHVVKLNDAVPVLRRLQQRGDDFPERGAEYITSFSGDDVLGHAFFFRIVFPLIEFSPNPRTRKTIYFLRLSRRSWTTAPIAVVCTGTTECRSSIPVITLCPVITRRLPPSTSAISTSLVIARC